MKYEVYEGISATDEFDVFDFVSKGKNGEVLKRVAFTPTEVENVYNLAMGDVVYRNELDDLCVTDNGDRNRVLATVATIVDLYTKRFPERWILFRGATAERTRLYRMAIGINLEGLSEVYDIYGYLNGELVLFSKNMAINAFLIKRKKT